MRIPTFYLAIALWLFSASARADCFDDAAMYQGVNPWTLRAIAGVESSFDPMAVHRNTNGTIDRGLTQTNSVHLAELAKQGIRPEALFDACTSVYTAAWLLRKKIIKFGNTCAAIGAYKSETPSVQAKYIELIKHQLAVWGVSLDC